MTEMEEDDWVEEIKKEPPPSSFQDDLRSPSQTSSQSVEPLPRPQKCRYIRIPMHQWVAVSSTIKKLNRKVIDEQEKYAKAIKAVLPLVTEMKRRVAANNTRTKEDIRELKQQAADEKNSMNQKLQLVSDRSKLVMIRLLDKEKDLMDKITLAKSQVKQAQGMHEKEVIMNDEMQQEVAQISAENERLKNKLKDALFLGSNQTCATCKARDRVSTSIQDQVVQKSREIQECQEELEKKSNLIAQKDKIIDIFAKENPRIKFELKTLKESYERKLAEARKSWQLELERGFALAAGSTPSTVSPPSNTVEPILTENTCAATDKCTPPNKRMKLTPTPPHPSLPPPPPPPSLPPDSAQSCKGDSPELEEIGAESMDDDICILETKGGLAKTEEDWQWAHSQMYGYEELLKWYRTTLRNTTREKLAVEEQMVEGADKLESLTEELDVRGRDRDMLKGEMKSLRERIVQETRVKDRNQAELKKLAAEVKIALEEKDKEINTLKDNLKDLTSSVKSYFLEKGGDKKEPPPSAPPPGASKPSAPKLHGSRYPILRM